MVKDRKHLIQVLRNMNIKELKKICVQVFNIFHISKNENSKEKIAKVRRTSAQIRNRISKLMLY